VEVKKESSILSDQQIRDLLDKNDAAHLDLRGYDREFTDSLERLGVIPKRKYRLQHPLSAFQNLVAN